MTNKYYIPKYFVKGLKVDCRVLIWKKTFCQNNDQFGYSFISNDIVFTKKTFYAYLKLIN